MAKVARRCVCCGSGTLQKSPAVLMPFVANRVFDWEPVEVTLEWGLRDLGPGRAYPLCNTVHCERCGLLFLDLRFDDEEMARLYEGYRGDAYTRQRDRFEPGYAARNARMVAHGQYHAVVEAFLSPLMPPPAAVLDWGGDTGANTPFRRSAKVHHVHDISNNPLVDGALRVDADGAAEFPYDLVVLSEVLEHIPEPGTLLQSVKAAMRNHTTLYIEVPHEPLMRDIEQGRAQWRQKRHWHEHINFFSREALRELAAANGLRIVHAAELQVDAGNGPVPVLAAAARLA